jgi:hypothetical protein
VLYRPDLVDESRRRARATAASHALAGFDVTQLASTRRAGQSRARRRAAAGARGVVQTLPDRRRAGAAHYRARGS